MIRQPIHETLKDLFSGENLPQGVKQGMWSNVQERIRSQSVVKSSTLTKQVRPAMVWLGSILVAGEIAFGSVQAIQSRTASTTVSRHGLSPKGWHVTVPEGLQIGSLRLGAPLTDAITMYGDPQVKTTAHGTGGPEWIYTQGKPKTINTSGVVPLYSNFKIGVDGNPIWSISVNAEHSGSTPRGIHVGSTVAQLRRAYHGMFSDKQGPYAIQYDHGMFSLSFGVSHGRVTQINIVKNMPPF